MEEEQEKKKAQEQDEVLHAIEVVKSHYLLIEKLRRLGTSAQRQQAASAMAVISRYNEIMVQAGQQPLTWSLRIAHFFYERIGDYRSTQDWRLIRSNF